MSSPSSVLDALAAGQVEVVDGPAPPAVAARPLRPLSEGSRGAARHPAPRPSPAHPACPGGLAWAGTLTRELGTTQLSLDHLPQGGERARQARGMWTAIKLSARGFTGDVDRNQPLREMVQGRDRRTRREPARARAVDTALLPEQARHVLAGPDLARNAVQLGTALQHLKQTGALLRAQRWRRSEQGPRPDVPGPAARSTLVPLALPSAAGARVY